MAPRTQLSRNVVVGGLDRAAGGQTVDRLPGQITRTRGTRSDGPACRSSALRLLDECGIAHSSERMAIENAPAQPESKTVERAGFSVGGLRSKIALVLTGTVFTLLMVATLALAERERRDFLTERTDLGIFVADALADLISREGGLAQPDRVQRLVRDYGKTAGVISVRVVDRNYSVVAAVQFENRGRTYRSPDIIEAIRHGIPTAGVREAVGPSLLYAVVPIREDGRLAGAVEVGMDLEAGQRELRNTIVRGLLVAVLVAGVTTLLSIWSLTLIVVRPVTRFARVSQTLARGDFDVEIPGGGRDEIGQLGRALLRMRDSLRELSGLWKDQNPLTGLPGNLAIQRELRRVLEAGRRGVVLYADLDTFKAFNDRYGFDRGDQLLKFTARVFADTLQERGGKDDFLGHVGGDDFVLIVDAPRAEVIATEAIRRFDAGVAAFYDQEDQRRGYVETRSRRGQIQRIPQMSLTVVGVPIGERPMNVLMIGETVAELKSFAKRSAGSKFVMDRRMMSAGVTVKKARA